MTKKRSQLKTQKIDEKIDDVPQYCYKICFVGGYTTKTYAINDSVSTANSILDEAIELFARKYGQSRKDFEWIKIEIDSTDSNMKIFHIECEEIFVLINERNLKMEEIIKASILSEKKCNVIVKAQSRPRFPDCATVKSDLRALKCEYEILKSELQASNDTHEMELRALKSELQAVQISSAEVMKALTPMHLIYRRCLIYTIREIICNKLGRRPVNGKWWSFLEGVANSQIDLRKLGLSNSEVHFIQVNADDGNKVAHGQDAFHIAFAVTAIHDGARPIWLRLFKIAYGNDATAYLL